MKNYFKIFYKYFLIFFFSILLSFYLFECYLNINLWKKESLLKFYNNHIIKNPYITLRVPPFFFISNNTLNFQPLAGISKSKTIINCFENGFYPIYFSDRFGFNNEDEIWDKKVIDYVLVGDSMVHGECVHSSDNISSALNQLSKKIALNLGYGGNGPLLYLATIIEYLPSETKNVFLFYTEANDLINLKDEMKNKILINYLNENFSQKLKNKQTAIDIFLKKNIFEQLKYEKKRNTVKMNFLKFIRLDQTKKIIKKKFMQDNLQLDEKDLNNFFYILNYTNNFLLKKNVKMYFVYLPEYKRYASNNYNNKNYNKILDHIKKNNIPYIDMHKEFFSKEKNPKSFFADTFFGHYTAVGYKKIAEIIFKFTNKN